MTLLPSDGTFIDIGANVGMATLSASAVIGPNGRVIAFEPNPAVVEIFEQSMQRNGLEDRVTLHKAAIADKEGSMAFFVPFSNHGEGSLAGSAAGREGRTIEVSTTTAQDLLDLPRIDLVKIDVEGFELSVMKSITPMLNRFHPPVIAEVMDEHLSRADTDSRMLEDYMATLGYRPFAIAIEDAGLLRQRARLSAVSLSGDGASCNALWLHDSNRERVLETEFLALRK